MSALYTPEMLALSTRLSSYPWSADLALQAEARSDICGSTISIGLDLDESGRVSKIGLKVSACAVGQSSAAILADAVQGASPGELAATLHELRLWLANLGDLPAWPRLEVIKGARPHAGRHGALLLPWEAALKALSSVQ